MATGDEDRQRADEEAHMTNELFDLSEAERRQMVAAADRERLIELITALEREAREEDSDLVELFIDAFVGGCKGLENMTLEELRHEASWRLELDDDPLGGVVEYLARPAPTAD